MTVIGEAAPARTNIGWVIGATFRVVFRRWLDLLLVAAPFVGLPTVLAQLAATSLGGGSSIYSLAAGLPGLVFTGAGSLITYSELAGSPRIGAGEAIRRGGGRFGSLWATAFLSNLGIVPGLLLLIAPGVILMVGWMGASAAVVVEGKTATEGLGRSWQLSRGSRWRLAGLLGIALLGFSALLVVLTLVVTVLIISFGAGATPMATIILTPIWALIFSVFSTVGSAAAYTGLRIAKEGDAGDVAAVFA